MLYFVVYLVVGVSAEGSIAHQHLVYNDAQSPPVDQLGVPDSPEHFGSDVVGCAHCAEGKFSVFAGLVFLQILLEGRKGGVSYFARDVVVYYLVDKAIFLGLGLFAQPEI